MERVETLWNMDTYYVTFKFIHNFVDPFLSYSHFKLIPQVCLLFEISTAFNIEISIVSGSKLVDLILARQTYS